MKKVQVVTKARGFWADLFEYKFENISFSHNRNNLFEVPSKVRSILNKFINYEVFDYIGLFMRVKVRQNINEINFSYNRFLKSKKPYLIGLENPTALVHYSDTRMKTFISKIRLKKCFNDPKLKGIICLSKACYSTIEKYYDIRDSSHIYQVYPLILENPNVTEEYVSKKSKLNGITCLYISSNFTLKGGADILETFKKLRSDGLNHIKLIIVTKVDELASNFKKSIDLDENIELFDFSFDKNQLYDIYSKSNILLNPSRMDSFSLVTLEAMKNGCCIISTDIYAIKEMVTDGINGFLTKPRYEFWNNENMINHDIKVNPKKTYNSNYVDYQVSDFMYKKIKFLYENKKELERMSTNSFLIATTGEFSSKEVAKSWENIINNI